MSALPQHRSTDEFPMARSLLIGLLTVYMSVVWLHFFTMPLWLLVLFIGVILWRINLLRERWPLPSLWIKVVVMVATAGLLWLEYQQWFAVEPMITLLLVALSLKLLEIRHRRDFLLILLVSYFAIACSFLFEQGVLHSLTGLLAVVITTAVLSQLYSTPTLGVIQRLRLITVMLLQSIALMLVMLLVLPRLNPLWYVPLHSGSGITGISDSMSPGDFDQLIRSNELAMRVTFEGEPLDRSQMYWRGIVFDHFDGRRWKRVEPVSSTIKRQKSQWDSSAPQLLGSPLAQYEVLMEASGQHWLFGIPVAAVEVANSADISSDTLIYTPQQEIFYHEPVQQRIKYQAYVFNDQRTYYQDSLSAEDRDYLTRLPEGMNPQTIIQAKTWWKESGNEQNYIQRVLTYYRNNFTYTLSPPKLGEHTVDEFLFSTQQGFCEHFSSSFVVLMRSVGIPSRIVVGYQGGSWSDDQKFLSVYQRDAHAWAEVWLSGQGWTRVDPTAAVASIRIEQGLEAALPTEERQQLSIPQYSYAWASRLYNQWQLWDYLWQSWVLSYDSKQQQTILSRYLGDITPDKMVLAIMLPLLLIAVMLGVMTLRHTMVPRPMAVRLHQKLNKKLHKLGVKNQAGESVAGYCRRAAIMHPHLQQPLATIERAFERVLYAEDGDWREIKEALRQLNS